MFHSLGGGQTSRSRALGMSTSPREPYLYRKLVGARFQLYRRRFLQVNIRWKALDEIYKIRKPLHRSEFKTFRFSRKSKIFCRFFPDFTENRKQIRNLQQLPKDVNFSISLRDRRENFSMFVFFMLFSGIALILISKKKKKEIKICASTKL